MLFKLCLGRFFFSSEDALDIFTYTFIVKATKWRSRQAISRINSTCPRQEKYARNQFWKSFWKVQVNLVPRFSLLFLSCGRVVGWRDPLVGPDHVATRILGGKKYLLEGWGSRVSSMPGCEIYCIRVGRLLSLSTSVYALMETFRQIFILRIV